MIEYFNEDCMVGMARYPDKHFDLAIVDPPYGIDVCSMRLGKAKCRGGEWDFQAPEESYFNELIRVSKNQIAWGGNHFPLPLTRSWIFWDKDTNGDFSDGELAWTSFDKSLKRIRLVWDGFRTCEPVIKIHPTQKPVALYKWLLKNYAKQGDLILDTHVGSASSLIACHDMGFDAVGFELDKDYYDKSKQRLEDFMKQPRLDAILIDNREQISL